MHLYKYKSIFNTLKELCLPASGFHVQNRDIPGENYETETLILFIIMYT